MRFVLFVLLVSAPAAFAAAPEVEVGALCRDVAWTGTHLSSTILMECRRWEGDARAEVAAVWETLPAQVRRHCRRLGFANGTGSYKAIAICIRSAAQ